MIIDYEVCAVGIIGMGVGLLGVAHKIRIQVRIYGLECLRISNPTPEAQLFLKTFFDYQTGAELLISTLRKLMHNALNSLLANPA